LIVCWQKKVHTRVCLYLLPVLHRDANLKVALLWNGYVSNPIPPMPPHPHKLQSRGGHVSDLVDVVPIRFELAETKMAPPPTKSSDAALARSGFLCYVDEYSKNDHVNDRGHD
jgi:hypothetical protein